MGGLGAERPMAAPAQERGRRRGAFCVMGGVTTESQWMVKNILESMAGKGRHRTQGNEIGKVDQSGQKSVKNHLQRGVRLRSEMVGHVIAEALNANAPSFLLINDLHRLPEKEDMEQFLQILYVVTNEIVPGVLVVLSGDDKYFKGVLHSTPPSMSA